MIVNRVFCYSKDVARQNGNKLPILQLVLSTVIFLFLCIFLAVILDNYIVISMLMYIVFMGIFLYYSVVLSLRLRNRMTGWATSNDGRIFRVFYVNNGNGLYFGGVAAGGVVDQLAGNGSNLGKNIGGAVGTAAQIYSMNKASQYMSHPEIIAKIVEDAPNVTGAEVYEILNVYSSINSKYSIKLTCDYRIARTGKIKYKKTIYVEKSFNQINDLINTINKHKK